MSRAWKEMMTHPFNRAEAQAAGIYLAVLVAISMMVLAVNWEWVR